MDSVKVKLFANGEEKESKELSEANHWKHTFERLPKYDNNNKIINYSVKEELSDWGRNAYESKITGNAENGFVITNTNITTRDINVRKFWNQEPPSLIPRSKFSLPSISGKQEDKDDIFKLKQPTPESITVRLLADGKEIASATITEADGWEHFFKDMPIYDKTDGHHIEYTCKEDEVKGYKSEIEYRGDYFAIVNKSIIDIPVEKKWIGKRGDSATIHLYREYEVEEYNDETDTLNKVTKSEKVKTIELNENNNWKYVFEGLEKFYFNESGLSSKSRYYITEDAIDGYESKITGNADQGFVVTNTNTNIHTDKISIPIVKQWVGKAADKVEVKLLADGIEKATVTLTAATDWKHTFKDLPKYDEKDGHEIAYTISEVKVDGYTTGISGTAKDGFTITNTITGKVSIPVTKTWVGKAADKVRVRLLANGKEISYKDLSSANNWQHTFENYPKYDKDGKEIKYTVKEDKIAGYKAEITGDIKTGFTIKNSNIEKVSVPIVKQWVGKSTDKVEVKLLADGIEKATVTLTAATDWKHTFKDLPKYDEKDGHEIAYTISEVKVDGYTTGISGTAKDGFTITNTITGKVSVPVTKTWVGKEGTSAKIHLYADGRKLDSVTLSKANKWQHTFTNLEKYKDGKEIKYTIKEDVIENYKSEITGDMTLGFTVKNTNTEKLSIPIVKQWVGKAADKVEVKLLADGIEKATVTLTAATDWKHTFKDLPKYDEKDGHEITYTISEVKVDGYTTG
ncbi:Cna B-type domain-containing protein, partial [Streptococcus castoreus]